MTIKVEVSGDGKEIDITRTRRWKEIGYTETNLLVLTQKEALKLMKDLNRMLGECPQE